MPLSEHEQRLLEQIEQALYAEDPKFAHSWRVRDLHSLRRAKVVRAVAVAVVGLGLLIAGVVTQATSTVLGVALGVAGFLLMLAGAWLMLSVRQRAAAPAAATGAAGPGRPRRPRVSIRTRLEERWQRRQGDL